ncbi:fungal-specific transcription factor domain-containing protein [Xylariales sp. PMI_506]|nr:fungal-specific transcription factor domain-containing protein [Xylariales sp. PMI_506]
MTGIVGDPSTSSEFFGSSSAGTFLRQINSAIDARLGLNRGNTNGVMDLDGSSTPRGKVSTDNSLALNRRLLLDPTASTLPPRQFADKLLEAYYDLVWAVFPIHDRPLFQSAYESVWLPSSADDVANPLIPERMLYCMMNIIFALGSQFSELVEPTQRREVGQMFWARSQKLFEPYEDTSLEGVQILLLMGMFLQTTCESHKCWMTIGNAIRMAQSLGLHMADAAGLKKRGKRELEIARRVWSACIFKDRLLSLTFGRPSMIARWLPNPVPPPLMIDDEFLDTQKKSAPIRPDGKPALLAFFIKSDELYNIVNDVLLVLYMNFGESHGNLVSVLQFDDRLVQWAHSLPEQLHYSPQIIKENSDGLVFQRQKIVLRARYLHARIITLRPIVSDKYLKQSPIHTTPGSERPLAPVEPSLSQQLVTQCATICFGAAHELIDVIYSNFNFDTVTGPVPAWWFAVLFIYTAATVLLAERLRPVGTGTKSTGEGNSAWSQEASWNKAMKLLQAYCRVGDSAKRCIAALEILSAKIQEDGPSKKQHDLEIPEGSAAGDDINNVLYNGPDAIGNVTGMSQQVFEFEELDLNMDDVLWLNSSIFN